MELTSLALPGWLAALAWLASASVLALALVRSPWPQLRTDAGAHASCGGIVVLALLWSMQPQIATPTSTHLLGVAAYTLLVGPALAAIGTAVALALAIAMHDATWMTFGAAYVVTGIIPIAVTWLVPSIARRVLPRNPLVHVLVDGWLGGALSVAASQAVAAVVIFALLEVPLAVNGGDLVALVACLASGEATLTGVVVTLLAIAQPHALAALRERVR